MTIQTQVLINLPTHHAHVTVEHTGRIRVFKYDAAHCDFDVFEPQDQFSASDYITMPLPSSYMRVCVHGDPDTDGAY
jgi:hypothetical protein